MLKFKKNNSGAKRLKDNNRALVARLGPEINSQACLCVLQGLRQNTRCWFPILCFIFLLMFCLETPKKGSGPTNLSTEPSLSSWSAISIARTPAACPGTQYGPTACRVDISFNAFWHCHGLYVQKSCNNYSKKKHFVPPFKNFVDRETRRPKFVHLGHSRRTNL